MRAVHAEAARALAMKALAHVAADEAEVVVLAHESALTRFADDRIHQNVTEHDAQVRIRAIVGRKTGCASTNQLDSDSLQRCASAAAATARVSPPDEDFPGLPAPREIARASTGPASPDASLEPRVRAEAVARIVGRARARGISAAGGIESSLATVAVANSQGVAAASTLGTVRATVLTAGKNAGSGWASYYGRTPTPLDPEALGNTAVELALRSASPVELEPGTYPVVLAPEAVADLVDFLGYLGFSARALSEGRSFMSGNIGSRIIASPVTIVDDANEPGSCGMPFDFEGQPAQRITLIDRGVASSTVTDSYWAARTGAPNTGHALPAPNSLGPLPLNMAMAPGECTVDDLIASVGRGVYVTRFHYVNVEDPLLVTLTGMTRDGTFLIERGKLSSPLKNLRFTQEAIDALATVEGVSAERTRFKTMLGSALVPALLLERWRFTGQTE